MIGIRFEEEIRKDLWETMEGDIIKPLLKEAKVEKTGNYYKYYLEGHSFKVNEALAPDLYKLFRNVCDKLNFTEAVEFYITNSPELNASASSRTEDGEPHLININSAIVEKYTDNELEFVIGHELGHIISKNIELTEIINFIFPNTDSIPLLLYNKIMLWEKLAELTADRYGFIASGDLEKCVSAFFKLSSGLDLATFKLDFETFLEENDKRLESFKNENAINVATHPINPIRIKSLQYFSESELYKSITNKETKEDPGLASKMEDLTSLLLVIRNSELDKHRSMFIASAGIIMASIDDQVSEKEYEMVIRTLSQYLIFPKGIIDDIAKNGDPQKTFIDSTGEIMKYNPAERDTLFDFLINVGIADNQIFKSEIDFLYEAGEKLFGFTKKEIAQKIGIIVRGNFIPKLYQ